MFEKFPSLTRFSHDWTITEKIDGTNAHILFSLEGDEDADKCLGKYNEMYLYAGSRNRFITLNEDNAGFARWAFDHAQELADILGEGRHYGEWCGAGIQRRYDLPGKKFALFNTHRWRDLADHPDGGLVGGQLTVVPVLAEGYMDNPGQVALHAMGLLKANGSTFALGFMNPEGVVMRHNPSGTTFKKTFDYDEQGKWAEKQALKNTA